MLLLIVELFELLQLLKYKIMQFKPVIFQCPKAAFGRSWTIGMTSVIHFNVITTWK